MDGGGGNDQLIGGSGNDRYLIKWPGGSGDTNGVSINDAGADGATSDDRVEIANIAHDRMWLARSADDLRMSVIGTQDVVTFENWYGNTNTRIDRISAGDGYWLLSSNVAQLVNAMAGFAPPPSSQQSLTSAQHAALDSVIAANWQSS